MNTKKICAEGNGVIDVEQAYFSDNPETFFTEREIAGIVNAMAKNGPPRWVSASRAYGTDGYIFQQARTMALNPHRMPSQCIMLFDAEQKALFWSYTNKLEHLQANPNFREQVLLEIQSQWRR